MKLVLWNPSRRLHMHDDIWLSRLPGQGQCSQIFILALTAGGGTGLVRFVSSMCTMIPFFLFSFKHFYLTFHFTRIYLLITLSPLRTVSSISVVIYLNFWRWKSYIWECQFYSLMLATVFILREKLTLLLVRFEALSLDSTTQTRSLRHASKFDTKSHRTRAWI